jgi:Antibiotic biosynthesis monooxygenase
MAHHLRIALYDLTSGTVEEAVEIARKGMIPLYEAQPGFVRYDVGTLDDGGVVSFSVWETSDEAETAITVAANWVKENLAERINLREQHTGTISWEEEL